MTYGKSYLKGEGGEGISSTLTFTKSRNWDWGRRSEKSFSPGFSTLLVREVSRDTSLQLR